MHKMIPYGRHYIDKSDIDAVIRVLQSDWLTCGTAVEKFELALADTVKAQHAISCSNGTTALHLALLGLGIEAGDIVLVPAITFLATANAVRYVNADVIFVDVDPGTGLMTAETFEVAILQNKSKALKAVINVHLAGQCEDLEAIYNVAKKYNLLVIDDASHALGTAYIGKNKKPNFVGSNAFSDITTFSFHPVKTIAMGEGGAVTTNNSEIAKKIRAFRSHGMIREVSKWANPEQGLSEEGHVNPWYYEMQELGYNYRISDINCALGVGQLEKLASFKLKRSIMVNFYDKFFAEKKHILLLNKHAYSDTCWHLYSLLIDYQSLGKSRAMVMDELHGKGIGTQVHYIPLYKQPYYKKLYGSTILAGAEAFYAKCLSLPLFVGLTDKHQEYIVDAVTKL